MGKCIWVGYLIVVVEVSIVVTGMYPCIGSSAACDGDRLSQFQAQVLLHNSLNASSVRLYLIAVIAAPVVSQMDEITRHRIVLDSAKIQK